MKHGARRALACGVLWLAAGCAASATTQHVDALRARFAQADALRARQLAPDLYARAERAWQDAKRAGEPDSAADHEARARLLLAAAVAEAERIVLERAASAAEARATRAQQQRAQLERERVELEQAAERDRAAQSGRADAARVFQRLETREQEHSARGAVEREAQRARDAEVVRRHALLMLAAADALGLERQRSDRLAQTIAIAEHAANGTALLAAARAALAEAERALGDARKARGTTPTQAESAALIALAQERGLEAQASPRGVVVALDSLFVAGSAQPTALGKFRLEQSAALVRAHPHGAVEIEVPAGGTDSAGARSLARARADQIAHALRGATDAGRLQVRFPSTVERSAEHAQLVFAAYGRDADAKVPPQPVAAIAQPRPR
jgi:hypothetical protein